MNAVLTSNLPHGAFWRDFERSFSGVLAGELCQHVNQCWGCSQLENELERRDATDWLMDDEMMRQ